MSDNDDSDSCNAEATCKVDVADHHEAVNALQRHVDKLSDHEVFQFGSFNGRRAAQGQDPKGLAQPHNAMFLRAMLTVWQTCRARRNCFKLAVARVIDKNPLRKLTGTWNATDFIRWVSGVFMVMLKQLRFYTRENISPSHAARMTKEELDTLRELVASIAIAPKKDIDMLKRLGKGIVIGKRLDDCNSQVSTSSKGTNMRVEQTSQSLVAVEDEAKEPDALISPSKKVVKLHLKRKNAKPRSFKKCKDKKGSSERSSVKSPKSPQMRKLKANTSDVSVGSDGWPRRATNSPASPTATIMDAYFSGIEVTKGTKVCNATSVAKKRPAGALTQPRGASTNLHMDVQKLISEASDIAKTPFKKTNQKKPAAAKPQAVKKGDDDREENTAMSETWGKIRRTLATNAAYITYDTGDGWTSIFNITKAVGDKHGKGHKDICNAIFKIAQGPNLSKAELTQMRDKLLQGIDVEGLRKQAKKAGKEDEGGDADDREGEHGECAEEEFPRETDKCVDEGGDVD